MLLLPFSTSTSRGVTPMRRTVSCRPATERSSWPARLPFRLGARRHRSVAHTQGVPLRPLPALRPASVSSPSLYAPRWAEPQAATSVVTLWGGRGHYLGLRKGRHLLPPEVLLTAAAGQLRIPFNRRSLRRLGLAAAFFSVTGVAMIFDAYVLFGQTVPTPFRIALGLSAVALGGFLGRSALTRARSVEPAIEVCGTKVAFHVNPGRRVTLNRTEVRGIGQVRPVAQRSQRLLLGGHVFEVYTTRPEGLRAASILVGSRYIDQDISTVRDDLAAALR